MAGIKDKLDAWLVLHTIVEEGGFAQAAQALGRSQSAVSYAIASLQDQLGLKLLRTQGRRAVLTAAGARLLDQARLLLAEHTALNALAQDLKDGREPQLQIAVEAIVPINWLAPALARLNEQFPGTRVQLCQFQPPWQGHADLILTQEILVDEPVTLLATLQLVPVAHSEHPLARASRPLTQQDLGQYPEVTITPAPATHSQGLSWMLMRCDQAVALIRRQLAYGWLPQDEVQGFIDQGEFKVLPLGEDGRRVIPIYCYSTNTRPGQALAAFRALLLEITQNRAGLNAG